jgi:hypothetical protein
MPTIDILERNYARVAEVELREHLHKDNRMRDLMDRYGRLHEV